MIDIRIEVAENGYVVRVYRDNRQARGIWVAGNREVVEEIIERILPSDFPDHPGYISPQLPEDEKESE